MKLKFLNHASVLFDCGSVKILTDPWYSGKVFNEGWSLVCDGKTDINELDFNFLWYSHEHPDHFRPEELKKIPSNKRGDILFQKTADQKVAEYCKHLGFCVMELRDCDLVNIGGVQVQCGQSHGFDSWLRVTHEGKTALNVNDCRVETKEDVLTVKEIVGDVDVLLTQFGWANWVGNKGDDKSRATARRMAFERTGNQIKYLKPNHIIPFASFCTFSHEENVHCNEGQITAREFVYSYPDETVVVLSPEEEWEVGDSHDTEGSLQKWENLYSNSTTPLGKSEVVSLSVLNSAFEGMKEKLNKNNDMVKLRKFFTAPGEAATLPPTTIRLSDYGSNTTVVFNIFDDKLKFLSHLNYDVSMSSNSLLFLMKFAWGRGTLTVNGRFQANYKTFNNFLKQTQLYYNNNVGKTYPTDVSEKDIIGATSFVSEVL